MKSTRRRILVAPAPAYVAEKKPNIIFVKESAIGLTIK